MFWVLILQCLTMYVATGIWSHAEWSAAECLQQTQQSLVSLWVKIVVGCLCHALSTYVLYYSSVICCIVRKLYLPIWARRIDSELFLLRVHHIINAHQVSLKIQSLIVWSISTLAHWKLDCVFLLLWVDLYILELGNNISCGYDWHPNLFWVMWRSRSSWIYPRMTSLTPVYFSYTLFFTKIPTAYSTVQQHISHITSSNKIIKINQNNQTKF